jgi:hypothetical protein
MFINGHWEREEGWESRYGLVGRRMSYGGNSFGRLGLGRDGLRSCRDRIGSAEQCYACVGEAG